MYYPPAMSPDLSSLFPASVGELPSALRIDPRDHPARWMVSGQVRAFSGDSAPVRSPIGVRGEGGSLEAISLGVEAQLGEAQVAEALAAAESAWADGTGAWPMSPVGERIACLDRFASELEARTERVAALLMLEIGKPAAAARKEVSRSVEYIRETHRVLRELASGWERPFSGTAGSTVHHALESRFPLGIVLCVAPFNYPVNEFLTTIAPALVMGNVVIAKTPRFGVLATLELADAFAACLPAGTVSILPGDGRRVIPPIMGAVQRGGDGRAGRGRIDVLAFIGSEAAAHAILTMHPSPETLHKILGLGAKNAAIVLPGADVEAIAPRLVAGALGFNGQRCTAEKILYAPRQDAERLATAVAARVGALSVGMPWTPGVDITPMPEPGKAQWMGELVRDAVAHGARVANEGGGAACGSLMRPAVVAGVTPAMRLFHEEQFGPLMPIAAYDSLDQAIEWQRLSPYGQQVGLWGPPDVAAGVARALAPQVARININDVCQRGPDSFGFTATDRSGFGVLSLRDALLSFSRPVLVQSPVAEQVVSISRVGRR